MKIISHIFSQNVQFFLSGPLFWGIFPLFESGSKVYLVFQPGVTAGWARVWGGGGGSGLGEGICAA